MPGPISVPTASGDYAYPTSSPIGIRRAHSYGQRTTPGLNGVGQVGLEQHEEMAEVRRRHQWTARRVR